MSVLEHENFLCAVIIGRCKRKFPRLRGSSCTGQLDGSIPAGDDSDPFALRHVRLPGQVAPQAFHGKAAIR